MGKHTWALRCVAAGVFMAGLVPQTVAGAIPAPQVVLTHIVDQPIVIAGTVVTYSMTVATIGTDVLTDVHVTSSGCLRVSFLSGDTDGDAAVDPGESWHYGCSGPVLLDATVVASVSATAAGTTVAATASAEVDVVHPAIHVEKYAPVRLVAGGGTARFTVSVRNEGDVRLGAVTESDPLAADCYRAAGTVSADGNLDPHEQVDYECSMQVGSNGITNIVHVSATPPVGQAVTDMDFEEIDVVNPRVEVEMYTANRVARTGDLITYTVSVKNLSTATNPADGQLTDVVVSSPVTPGCSRVIGTLGIGGRVDYECTSRAGTEDFITLATVTATPRSGPSVSDDDPCQQPDSRP